MAKRSTREVQAENGIKSAFKKGIEKVEVYDNTGNTIFSASSANDFLTKFRGLPENKRKMVAQNNSKIVVFHNKDSVASYNKAKGAFESFRKAMFKSFPKRNNRPSVSYEGKARSMFGDKLKEKYKPPNFIDELDANKTTILGSVSQEEIVNKAKLTNPKRYLRILSDHGISEKNSDAEKAQAVIQYVRNTTLKHSKNDSPGSYAAQIVADIGKENDLVLYNELVKWNKAQEKKLRENFKAPTTERDIKHKLKKARYDRLKKEYGSGWKIIEKVKRDNKWNEEQLLDKLESGEANALIANRIRYDTAKGNLNKRTAKNLMDNLKITGDLDTPDVKPALSPTDQKKLIGKTWFGYSAKEDISDFFWEKLQGTEGRDAAAAGNEEKLINFKPKSVDYNELREYFGKEPEKKYIKRLLQYNVDIENLPPDIKEKMNKTKIETKDSKTSGLFSKKSKSSSKSSKTPSGKRSKYAYGRDDKLLGSTEIAWRGGKPHTVKKRGTISQRLHETKSKIPGIRSPEEKRRRVKEKAAEKKKLTEEKAKELKEDKVYDYLLDEEKEALARTSGWAHPIKKKKLKDKAKKMYQDPAYRAKQKAKEEERKGIAEADLIKAREDSRRRRKAAASPFWKVWYLLSHNIFVLAGVVLLLSIAFIPVGLFYVVGWGLAVGFVSLFMFIIWVFMEFWFMLAQVIVALIGIVAQAITGAFNYVGVTVGRYFGMTFTQFKYQYVQDLDIPNAEGVLGYGYTWGQWNLVPPNFLKLDSFMPTEFNTNTILGMIAPPIADFFKMIYSPIADRYLNWIASADWYYIGAMIGIPIVLMIIGIVGAVLYMKRVKRRMY